jgi:hypothetical protein
VSEKKVVLIFGKRGSGKSYFAQSLIAGAARLVIYDTLGEHGRGVVFDRDQYDLFRRFWKGCYQDSFRIVYRPIEPDLELAWIAELVWECGDVTFLVEEVDTFCSAYRIEPEFANIIQRGRHRNITLIGITQRPYGIHRLLTSQAKEIYIFATNEPRDREYLRNLIGQDVESKLDQLSKYQFVRWQDGSDGLIIAKVGQNERDNGNSGGNQDRSALGRREAVGSVDVRTDPETHGDVRC